MKKRKGYFSISAVSKMLGVHQQTIRMYEREGLICPKRSDGNTRLFSEEDVDRLEQIIYYTNKMGVNLAGIEIIFKMEKHIQRLQKELQAKVNDLFIESQNTLERQREKHFEEAEDALKRLEELKSNKNFLIRKTGKEDIGKKDKDTKDV